MSPIDPSPSADRDPVERLAEEFVERQRRGERPSLTEYTGNYPELAEAILDLFPALVMMERLKPAAEETTGSVGDKPVSSPDHFGQPIGRMGDYKILREVGRGGMGIVYEAVQESMGRHVALKILPMNGRLGPTQIERFQLEARSAGRLQHGNIVPVYGVGVHEHVHYFAMQFIHGHGLDAILDDLRRLRGRVQPMAAAHIRDGNTLAAAGQTGSLAAARSLLTGDFEKDKDAADNHVASAVALGQAPTVTTAGPDFSPVIAVSGGPESTSPGLVSADTSVLSLTTESQFHRSVARIGLQVADALAYAHQQGVLHRDIKPSNLLLDVAGNVWVTDFGLAKVEGSDGPTQTGDIVGTVRYMAPERFDGWSDRRSDVYSLGATVYELLTLHPLFAGAAQAELIEKVLHATPESPRKLDPKIPRDLENIVLKALAKEPGERYATARELAEDLTRFLEDRPVLARRSTSTEQLWRWCRRNPGLAGATLVAATAILLLAMGATLAAWTFRDQRNRIQRADNETREQLFAALQDQARAGRFSRRAGQRFESLEALTKAARVARELHLPPERFEPLRDQAIACMALPDLRKTGHQVIHSRAGAVGFAVDSTMMRYALRFRDGTIQVRRVADDREVARFQARGDRDFFVFDFSPDGRYLMTKHVPDRSLTVWDIEQGTVAWKDPGPVRGVAAKFSPDSRRIALIHEDGELLIDDLATGRPSRRWRLPAEANDLAFRPDGAQIAVVADGRNDPTCGIFEVETGRLIRSIALLTGVHRVAWSPDGTTLATPGQDSKIYLWDAATGIKRSTLEGSTNLGLFAAFHPGGGLLASNGWEGRLRIWDPVLGWPVLSLTGSFGPEFTRDGRIVGVIDDQLTSYEVDPALEYRTFAHVSSRPMAYSRLSIRHDGRVLAVGTNRGVALWDLARGAELAFLLIGNTWHLMFEASGELLTNGSVGVRRWPIQLDRDRGEPRIGPPDQLRLPAGGSVIAEDQLGRIVALANYRSVSVATPERTMQVGPLDDCRYVAVSPDGKWLATGSHQAGAHVWRLSDAAQVAKLTIDIPTGVVFSPDGKWLMTTHSPCRLWAVGEWREARRIGGLGHCFSTDGRQLVVQDADKVLRLVETETGRTVARLESPDLCNVQAATLSPDGSRLVVSTQDGPAVHVWDLRAIRRRLAAIGLDWVAPAFAGDDSAAPTAPPLPPLQVDLGPLTGEIEQYTESSIQRYTARLKDNLTDAEAYHHRGHALRHLNRPAEAIEDFTRAIGLQPTNTHFLAIRGEIHASLKQYEPAIADLEAAMKRNPDEPEVRKLLAVCCNNRAWELTTGPAPRHNLERAQTLIDRALALTPGNLELLNTLGTVQYRVGRNAAAIATLERSQAAGRGQFDAFDLFLLSMAHHRLGHRAEARACFDRAVRWPSESRTLTEKEATELASFRSEAEAVLAAPSGELPDDVFAPPR